MPEWSFLTNQARALICIAHDPGVRLRDIAATLGITERTAFGAVTDLIAGGYVVKNKEGRRNRYSIQTDLPIGDVVGGGRTIGEVLELLVDAAGPLQPAGGAGADGHPGPGEAARSGVNSAAVALKGSGATQQ